VVERARTREGAALWAACDGPGVLSIGPSGAPTGLNLTELLARIDPDTRARCNEGALIELAKDLEVGVLLGAADLRDKTPTDEEDA